MNNRSTLTDIFLSKSQLIMQLIQSIFLNQKPLILHFLKLLDPLKQLFIKYTKQFILMLFIVLLYLFPFQVRVVYFPN